jgi:hypothetical protein
MKTLTILLPDSVSQHVWAEAKKQNVDSAALCSGVITEHFLEQARRASMAPSTEHEVPVTAPSTLFDVRKHFPGFPNLSIELAQRFVDESLELPETLAFKSFSGRGVGISPNFVFVPYLLKRQPGGIGVSFYGSPDKLNRSSLCNGRNPNYSRTTVHTQKELEALIGLIRRSYELKFGRVP